MMNDIYYKEESYKIMGACFEVYKEMGPGFLEAVYQECLGLEFGNRGIPFIEKPILELYFKGQKLEKTYEPDFICYEGIIIELKALNMLMQKHKAQALNYLKATNMKLAILVNFGGYPKVEYERIVL